MYRLQYKLYFNLLIPIFCILIFVCTGQNLRENISNEELIALKKFREAASELLKTQPEYITSDRTLVKWLRARDLDIVKAREMLKKALKWREENRIDEIIYEDLSHFDKRFPYSIDSVDKFNRPVLIIPMGKWDPRREIINGNGHMITRYMEKALEIANRKGFKLTNTTQTVPSSVLIVDANGFAPRIHMCLSCLPIYFNIVTNFDSYFPEAATEIFVINAPRIFRSLLDLITPFISELATARTKGINVQIYSHNKEEWSRALLKIIPSHQLSIQYGGMKEMPKIN